jgi:hypothetical protein
LVADPQTKKLVTEKRLISTCQKISFLALHTASSDPGWGLPVKCQKINRKINFCRTKKILRLKITKKNSLQDNLKTSKPIFEF